VLREKRRASAFTPLRNDVRGRHCWDFSCHGGSWDGKMAYGIWHMGKMAAGGRGCTKVTIIPLISVSSSFEFGVAVESSRGGKMAYCKWHIAYGKWEDGCGVYAEDRLKAGHQTESYESGLARSRSLGPRGPSPSVEWSSRSCQVFPTIRTYRFRDKQTFRRWAPSLPFSRPGGLRLGPILFATSQVAQIPSGSSPVIS